MTLVIDTDVVAAAVIDEPERSAEARRLMSAATKLLAPSHFKAELASVFWKAMVRGDLAAEDLDATLALTQALPIVSVDVTELWRGAVIRGVESRHPVYDTLFIELAVREGVPLASYDGSLRARFPDWVRAPRELLKTA